MLANHRDGFVRIAGRRIDVKRGQLAWSIVNLANRWRWSKGKVLRCLNEWSDDRQIEHQNIVVTTLITITNYDTYQSNDTPDDTPDRSPDRAPDGTPDGHQTVHKQEGKEWKEDIRIRTPHTPQGDLFVSDESGNPESNNKKSDSCAKKLFRQRICAIMHRGPNTKWSEKENKALNAVFPSTEEDISAIETYYKATIITNDFRRTRVETLLNNWPGEVDRAKRFISHTRNSVSSSESDKPF